MVSFVIEHMEEDDQTTHTFPPWVQLEYSHMRTLAGPSSTVHFTHVSPTAASSLDSLLSPSSPLIPPLAQVEVHTEGVEDLMKAKGVSKERVCLLDPKADSALAPSDGEEFDWFLFGGILGDDPPRDRTSELRALGFPGRHLGSVQMTTDTALGVTKLVVVDQQPLDQIPYDDFPTIRFNKQESVEMPFRYVAKDGQPVMPPGMKELLYEDLDKGFDF
ncbi:DUF431-domain-containing protein [Dacryopinax primogenitus]|uniref:DUF431-domain-containing protein n=1 Tax=Dacryopinax primogenitus (strain DJM 731) TaxID=1858805 RepID=M5FZW8_DACPD|nr:DUF431-domain-containing protein [Dacryopinax primogenitus]EJU01440.1 DUF431-domain-containing protein [Dacryopinax primogenitus]